MFPSTALAQAAQAAQKQPGLMDMLPMFAGLFLIMYFFMIRPQQKKMREHQSLLSQLKGGDEVITTGGIIGRVRSVTDGFVTLEIASNTNVKVLKSNISSLTKSEPAPKPAKK